ncbi:MAG: ROK family protein [Chloroflexi bacterium]|nr:ROK family protein [Chloroflexota bacterium]
MPVIAVDIGGTNIRVAIVSAAGQVVARESRPTLADEGPQAVIERILSAIAGLLDRGGLEPAQLDGISIAAAGAVDARRGVITASPNLPGWHDVPLQSVIREKFRADTFLTNDANAAALGEHRFGAGRGTSNLVYITVSTGIGGGIIIGGKLYSGSWGSAGEVGHMTIDADGPRCGCGNDGCLEALASGTAVAREAIARIRQGQASCLADMVKGEVANITAREVEQAARGGDSLASEVILRAATYLGIGVANLINIFDPEMIVIGGGMSRMGDMLFGPVRRTVSKRAYTAAAGAVRIIPSELGDDAGVIGAAVFAAEQKPGPASG